MSDHCQLRGSLRVVSAAVPFTGFISPPIQVSLGFSGPDRPIEFRCCGVHSIWGRTPVPSSGGIRGMARPSCCICDVQSNQGMCRSSDFIRHALLSHRMSVASIVCGTEFRPSVDRRCVASGKITVKEGTSGHISASRENTRIRGRAEVRRRRCRTC